MPAEKIKTFSTDSFRDRYMMPGEKLDEMLQYGFGPFLITRVEEMLRLIKLPVPPARSTIHSFICLTEGEAIMSIGNETYTIYKDECLFVPAGQVFSFSNLDENKGYICNFHNDFLIGKSGNSNLLQTFEFLTVWGNPRVSLPAETSQHVHHLLQRMLSDYTAYGLQHADLLQAYFIAVLQEINGVYIPAKVNGQAQSADLVNAFKKLVFQHIKTHQRVADYADMLHISSSHLNKVVRTATGKPPTKWIDEVLIMEAKVLLYQTSWSIGQIAAELGVLDASYFSRLFKKYENATPQEYRKRMEKS